MSVRHRYRGEVEPGSTTNISPTDPVGRLYDARNRLTTHRPPRRVGDGLQIVMRSIRGLTNPQVLDTPFHFQCAPLESFEHEKQFAFGTFDTIRKGQFSRPSGEQLATMTFDTVFVDYPAPFIVFDIRENPIEAVRRLQAVRDRGTPFELTIGQDALWSTSDVHWGPVNDNAAVITSVRVIEKMGEIDARYVTIAFQEYRSAELLRKRLGGRRDPARGRKLPAKVHIDRSTSTKVTLYSLSKRFYGEQSAWKVIAKASGIKDFSPSRPLVEYLRLRKEKGLDLTIPVAPFVARIDDKVGTLEGVVPGGWPFGTQVEG